MQTATFTTKVAMPGEGNVEDLKQFMEDLMRMHDLADFPVVVEYKLVEIVDTPDPAPVPHVEIVSPPYSDEPPEECWVDDDEWKAKARPILKEWINADGST